MSYSSGCPASNATGSNRNAASVTRSLRSSGAKGAAARPLSVRERVSISSTSSFIRRDSARMLSTYRCCSPLADSSSRSAEDRITVKGVFSSWLASEINCC